LLSVLSNVKTLVKGDPIFRQRTSRGCLVFQAPSGSARLCHAREILTDGTFPKIALTFEGLTISKDKFYQLVTIQSILTVNDKRGDQYLMSDSVVLLPDKKRETYDECFDTVMKITREDCSCEHFVQKILITDAEINLRRSAVEKLNVKKSSICFFHRAQAL